MSAIQRIEAHLHSLIRERLSGKVPVPDPLPALAEPFPTKENAGWMPVAGMYGGFRYWLQDGTSGPELVCESWSRVASGSGQRHVVTPEGYTLVARGFA